MRLLRTTGLAVALVAGLAWNVEAQVEAGQFQVTPYGGFFMADESSALKDAGLIGLEAVYYVQSGLAVGFTGSIGRGQSDGSYFPAFQWDVGPDTTRVFHVGQDLSIATYGAVAKLGIVSGRLAPYVVGGIGGWTLFLDPQSNNQPARVGGLALEAGAGVHVRMTERAGIRIDVRDQVFTDYDREDLNPVNPRFQSDVFLEPRPPEAKSTIHNIRLAFGFSYVPRR